jgi:hypothetical protein
MKNNKNGIKTFLKGSLHLTMAAVILFLLPVKEVWAGPFSKGNVRTWITAGVGHALGDDYFVNGAGIGYYIMDGLEAGLDVDIWFGGDPDIYSVSPELRYVFQNDPSVKPYVGLFYRHTFIEDLDDLDAVGFRGGLFLMRGGDTYLGLGAVYNSYLDCDEDVYSSCSETYPEIFISVEF